MTIKILDVGSSSLEDTAADIEGVFGLAGEELEITRLDVRKNVKPDIVHDITRPLPKQYHGAFDIVVASHVMEHIPRLKVLDTFQNIAECLRIGGEMYVIVPSMEWVAAEIYYGRVTAVVQSSLFGGQNHRHDYHKVGYTLEWLRFIMENVLQMVIRRAYQAPFTILIDDEAHQALQNIVIAMKVEIVEPEDE